MEGYRVKEFESNDKDEIYRWSSLRKVPFENTGNWMILLELTM